MDEVLDLTHGQNIRAHLSKYKIIIDKAMRKLSILVLLCFSPYLGNAQNSYKNSPYSYYNMDTTRNISTDTLCLPILEVVNPKLLSKIDKCINNYEKIVKATPDSLGSYFEISIFERYDLNYIGLSIEPKANFYLSYIYDFFKSLNRSYRELSIDKQDLYYGCFYYRNYLFLITTHTHIDGSIFPKLFNSLNKTMDINIYKKPYLGRYIEDMDKYAYTYYHYRIKKNKKGKISFEVNK